MYTHIWQNIRPHALISVRYVCWGKNFLGLASPPARPLSSPPSPQNSWVSIFKRVAALAPNAVPVPLPVLMPVPVPAVPVPMPVPVPVPVPMPVAVMLLPMPLPMPHQPCRPTACTGYKRLLLLPQTTLPPRLSFSSLIGSLETVSKLSGTVGENFSRALPKDYRHKLQKAQKTKPGGMFFSGVADGIKGPTSIPFSPTQLQAPHPPFLPRIP